MATTYTAAHLVASTKIMTVENQKSLGLSREQNPPSKTTVAQREARVPTALSRHSNKATQNTILFSHFIFFSLIAEPLGTGSVCRRSSALYCDGTLAVPSPPSADA